MTSKEKKEYFILALIILAILAVVYFNLIKKAAPAADNGTAVPAESAQAFLPYGSSLNTAILKDLRFRNLVMPSYPVPNPADIGTGNPFSQSASTPGQ